MAAARPSIPHSRPTLGPEEARAVAAVVRSGQLAQGPRVEQFEQGLAAFLGLRGGVALSSGSAALEAALLALGVESGDEVVLPSYTCAALWLAVTRVGALPRVVDIDLATFAIDPAEVSQALTSRTRAILVPHPFGLPADLTALQDLGVPLIEDCAQTLGAVERGRAVGTVGVMTVCSFYATKLLCTGEGGMLLSNDPAVLERVRALRDYDEAPRLDPAAWNRKMTELQAALGLVQLGQLRGFLEQRAALASRYSAALAGTGLILPHVPEGRSHVFYRYVVRLGGPDRSPHRVDDAIARLARRGVHCRRPVFRPIHQYLGLEGYPASEMAFATALSIPIYPSLTDKEVERTIQAVRDELG
ncbi:DegT/DnrJ/EryC1/StrS family aminotransferase [Nitrospira sp. Kam-Ns4a]